VSGLVSLIGAGPGDPELLTLKAARRLAEADLVLYDALVEPAALAHAPRAQRFHVGKRCGAPSVTQEEINRLLVQAGRRGRRVARLKCGDPFVLGRGGEEALALAAARVPFEVVPGVSSAIAAPALAGIPVTHRGISSGFAVISGHGEEAFRPALESIEPGGLTLVVLMGFASRARIAELLLRRGWSPSTPSAVLAGASTPAAWTWSGRLDGLASVEPPGRLGSIDASGPSAPPAILCIGPCVALAAELGQAGGRGASLPVPAAG
jgi:uroporphyrin-III C-methyltransferase/precorrin-2 dehydrogenase/sirohydrochlorin ferrochelatase